LVIFAHKIWFDSDKVTLLIKKLKKMDPCWYKKVKWFNLNLIVAVIISLFFAEISFGVTISAKNCSDSNVQSAINLSSNGDTVLVPAGNCNWSYSVTIPSSKGITLKAAGTSETIVTVSSTLTLETNISNHPVRVTGFKFIRKGSGNIIKIRGNAQNWRIDNNIFDDVGVKGAYTIEIGDKGKENGNSYNFGVIDHNQFINRNYGTSVHVCWVRSSLDLVASGDWIWSQPAQRGTAQAVYIEDNIFCGSADGAASQVVDTQYSGKVVVRYNEICDPWISTHSGCTNRGRNTPWTEIYKNTFNEGSNYYPGNAIEMRSTSGIVWGNRSETKIKNFKIGVDHERSYRNDCTGPYGGRADGTRSFDENAGLFGYRALGQPGWGPPQESDMSGASFAGVFVWGNMNGDSLSDLFIANNKGFTAEHLQFGRELFNASNMTIGPIEDRPENCSPGPAGKSVFISTNENSQGATIYVCTAVNVWEKHWEPYTYPHPLVNVGSATSVSPPAYEPTPTPVPEGKPGDIKF